jgi:predicted nuclease of predicted toxin-antitoxin system
MKFLLDMPVSFLLLDVLQAHGHEGVHAHQIGKDRASDDELLEIARRENRVIITADLDFPRLMALSLAEGPGLILFRGGNYSDREMGDLLARVLRQVTPEVLAKSICVVDRRRIRVTHLPFERKS